MEATKEQLTTIETAEKLGLSSEEYNDIKKILGRTPNFTELSIFSVMWSEHCSYKNSIKWLKTLPRTGPHMLVEAGEENAGLVDIGGGKACCFKIESHNHPSAIEPYQGAATGVGGINRDIFTMGARPIAQLNSLRFGNIKLDKTKWLLKGVVKGIGDYGNSFGVPVVGGEVFFDECYNTNPLINAMSVGIVEVKNMVSATSHGVGNPVFIVGSSTGKDGIHGATFASADITNESSNDLPSVQVGDPFQEKLLLEASLELSKSDAFIGMQDMGAAGITCSSSEMSEKGGCGMDIWLDKVPTRQDGMTPFEILLSESQERMLVVLKKGREEEVQELFKKWDINCVQIGVVTKGDTLRYFVKDEIVAEVPASNLVLGGGAPIYEREYTEPSYIAELQKFDLKDVPEPENLKEIAFDLLGNLNIASKKWVYEQYDSMVGTRNMSTNFPSDAGIVNVKGTKNALALTVDCNARYVYANPEIGAQIAVAEAARNIVCSGGEPSAITNCLNFGNPYNPEVYWQFVHTIKGMGMACKKFNTPVTGGNVSFYNQSAVEGKEIPVFPTPAIGMLGIIKDKKNITPLGFQDKGDLIFLLGESVEDISSSEYIVQHHKIKTSPAPHFDIEKEWVLQNDVKELISQGSITSAHDCADGGLWVTLVECALVNKLGFDIETDAEIRRDAFLFGEGQGRIVVTVNEDQEDDMIEYLLKSTTPFTVLGHVTKGKMVVDGEHWGFISDAAKVYDNALSTVMQNS